MRSNMHVRVHKDGQYIHIEQGSPNSSQCWPDNLENDERGPHNHFVQYNTQKITTNIFICQKVNKEGDVSNNIDMSHLVRIYPNLTN